MKKNVLYRIDGSLYRAQPDDYGVGCKGCAFEHAPPTYCAYVSCVAGEFSLRRIPPSLPIPATVEIVEC